VCNSAYEECLDCDRGGNVPVPSCRVASQLQRICERSVKKMRCRNNELTLLVVGNWDWDSSLGGEAWPFSSVFLDIGSPQFNLDTSHLIAKIHIPSISGFIS
jgi:hypothetical protein